jgi:anti-sigma factor RsiW
MACSEKRVVAYLSGNLEPSETASFEAHLMECDDCWTAVREDRQGREVAEGLHESAPAGLRDRVRARIEVASGRPRHDRRRLRLPLGLAAGALSLAAVAGGLLVVRQDQEPPIVAEVLQLAAAGTTQRLPAQAEQRIDGKTVALARYRLEGVPVVVARSSVAFPMPTEALPLGGETGEPWVARRDGMSLLCLSRPQHVLLAGRVPPASLLAFARGLGLAP